MNLALWDIQLKADEVPLWKHLGPVKDRVKAYNTDGGWLTWSTDEVFMTCTASLIGGLMRSK